MKRAVVMMLLFPVGTAATMEAAYVGLSGLRRSVCEPVVTEGQRNVTLEPPGLRYFEADNVLTLKAVASDRGDTQYVVQLPGEVEWKREMPNWCRRRRADVLAEIKRLSAGDHVRWLE